MESKGFIVGVKDRGVNLGVSLFVCGVLGVDYVTEVGCGVLKGKQNVAVDDLAVFAYRRHYCSVWHLNQSLSKLFS